MLSGPIDPDFPAAVRAVMARQDVHDAIRTLYADLQSAIDARKPRCDASGRCCRFEEFGHRLFITTAELGTFLHALQQLPASHPSSSPGISLPQLTPAGCIYQIDNLCSVHAIRPFGCRIFFCDPAADDWQSAQYELFHARIKHIHHEFAIPYHYMEWRSALQSLRASEA